jgi:hypothetical protein
MEAMTHRQLKSLRTRQWQQQNPERYRTKLRSWRMRTIYGLTLKDYDEMLKKQRGKCAICGKPPTSRRRLAVDHNHKTNKVRGLLCHVCNNFLGVYERNAQKFARYIERHKQ